MTDLQLLIITLVLAIIFTWLFIKILRKLPDQDAIEANQYMDEILNEAIMETTYLSKEHLLKEGWKEEPNSIHILYKDTFEIWWDDKFLSVEGGVHYGGKIPTLEQWEVLKDLLNLS